MEFDSLGLGELSTKLKEAGRRDLVAEVALTIAWLEGLTVPAFSWDKVAPKFGLDASRDIFQLESFSVPHLCLPPSFHREVMRNSAQWLDVYQEVGSHSRETARMRLMDAWHVPVCALFKGRIVDSPKHPTPNTLETSGGMIEHEVYMIEGIILIVMELKLYFKNLRDHFAQVLLELALAYQLNTAKEFTNQPPVYAVLTDLRDFYFLQYDGSKFTLHEDDFIVPTRSRSAFLDGMRNVTDHLFSIILEGYISNLNAVEARFNLQGAQGDVSQHNLASAGQPRISTHARPRPLLEKWTHALTYAISAQDALRQDDYASLEAWETDGVHGLSLLQSSVSYLSKIGSNTDWSQEILELEIDKVLCGQLKVPPTV